MATREYRRWLLDIVRDPEAWGPMGEYHITHTPSGKSLWIANGASFFNWDEGTGMPRIPFLLRFILWRRLMRTLERRVVQSFHITPAGSHPFPRKRALP